MGHDLADAIRDQLRSAVLAKYGTLEAAAAALGIPYKTLYRSLTQRGKDRTASVSLDFVLDVAQAVGVDFASLERRARDAVSAAAPSVTDAMDIADEVHGIDEGKKETYGLAAKRGRRKADIPHAE